MRRCASPHVYQTYRIRIGRHAYQAFRLSKGLSNLSNNTLASKHCQYDFQATRRGLTRTLTNAARGYRAVGMTDEAAKWEQAAASLPPIPSPGESFHYSKPTQPEHVAQSHASPRNDCQIPLRSAESPQQKTPLPQFSQDWGGRPPTGRTEGPGVGGRAKAAESPAFCPISSQSPALSKINATIVAPPLDSPHTP